MKLTINRITLLFGLLVYLGSFVILGTITIPPIVIAFGVCVFLGIRNRKSDKPYTYGRGLLVGIRILLLGIIFSIVFLLVVSFVKILIDSFRLTGVNIISATQNIVYNLLFSFPSLLAILMFSLIPMLVIPIFFLRKPNQTDDIIDADLMDNEQK